MAYSTPWQTHCLLQCWRAVAPTLHIHSVCGASVTKALTKRWWERRRGQELMSPCHHEHPEGHCQDTEDRDKKRGSQGTKKWSVTLSSQTHAADASFGMPCWSLSASHAQLGPNSGPSLHSLQFLPQVCLDGALTSWGLNPFQSWVAAYYAQMVHSCMAEPTGAQRFPYTETHTGLPHTEGITTERSKDTMTRWHTDGQLQMDGYCC